MSDIKGACGKEAMFKGTHTVVFSVVYAVYFSIKCFTYTQHALECSTQDLCLL